MCVCVGLRELTDKTQTRRHRRTGTGTDTDRYCLTLSTFPQPFHFRPAYTRRYLVSEPRKPFNTWSTEVVFPIEPEVSLENQPWFFGDIARKAAEQLLEFPGDFLVRFSTFD